MGIYKSLPRREAGAMGNSQWRCLARKIPRHLDVDLVAEFATLDRHGAGGHGVAKAFIM